MSKSLEISKKATIDIKPDELRAIMEEYQYDPDIMCDDDERVLKAKRALTKIALPDRIIFCIYLDLGASRKVGELLGVSHSTILKEINRIRKEIIYYIMKDDE